MKKNFISVLILGVTLINVIISAVTMISVVSTNQKTAKIVTDVATALSIDLGESAGEDAKEEIPIENIETYSIPEKMTLGLKTGEDGEAHFCMATVFFSMDITHADYKKYGATVGDNELIFRSIVMDVFQKYTVEEARTNQAEIKAEILKQVQNKYSGSDFIFDVSFSDIVFQ